MPSRSSRRLSTCLLWLLAIASKAAAQDAPMTPRDAHDRIVAVIARAASHTLPAGDTSVTWRKTPILYHTVSHSDSLIASGFVRNDGLTGVERVRWERGAPRSFQAVWVNRDSTLADLTGEVRRSELVLSGTRTGRFKLPTLPWAVCDYGMDEQLVPLLSLLPTDSTHRIAVFRPFGFRWDTLSVRKYPGPDDTFRIAEAGRTDTTRWTISDSGDLLQLTRDTTLVERRPLEETRLYFVYERVRITPRP